MLFNSPVFMFLFLPCLLIVYYLAASNKRNLILLGFSLLFYAWAEPVFIGIVLLSALFDWWLGSLIPQGSARIRKLAVLAGVTGNLGILIYFKYTNFLIDTLNPLLTAARFAPLDPLAIILPVGVSFIVFEKITYVVDIYRGTGQPARSWLDYMLFVLLFPKLLSGPIIKYHDIESQLGKRSVHMEDFLYGSKRFIYGLAKKVFIADTLAEVVEVIFAFPPHELGFATAWLGTLCFAMQIFYDFSGYSDMAIGLARMLGFRIMENFRMPYISQNFTEFWRRWHISLSTWIRDYIYYSLGGGRVSAARNYFNLWLSFLLSGLWHGANWTFVFLGFYHGMFLVLDKLFWLKFQKRVPRLLNIFITFTLVAIGFAIFRTDNIYHSWYYVTTLFQPWDQDYGFLYVTADAWFFLVLACLITFMPLTPLWQRINSLTRDTTAVQTVEWIWLVTLLVMAVARIAVVTFNPFLYFKF